MIFLLSGGLILFGWYGYRHGWTSNDLGHGPPGGASVEERLRWLRLKKGEAFVWVSLASGLVALLFGLFALLPRTGPSHKPSRDPYDHPVDGDYVGRVVARLTVDDVPAVSFDVRCGPQLRPGRPLLLRDATGGAPVNQREPDLGERRITVARGQVTTLESWTAAACP